EGVPGENIGGVRIFRWGRFGHDMEADFAHPPASVPVANDQDMHRLLAVIGPLKRAWSYQRVLRDFVNAPGNYLLTAATGKYGAVPPDVVADTLELPGTNLAGMDFPTLKTTLGLGATFMGNTDSDAAAVV